jgi:hypothetical protein
VAYAALVRQASDREASIGRDASGGGPLARAITEDAWTRSGTPPVPGGRKQGKPLPSSEDIHVHASQAMSLSLPRGLWRLEVVTLTVCVCAGGAGDGSARGSPARSRTGTPTKGRISRNSSGADLARMATPEGGQKGRLSRNTSGDLSRMVSLLNVS